MRAPARALAASVALAAAAGAGAAPVEISWDQDLVFESERERYQRGLGAVVDEAQAYVSAETGLALERPLRVEVLTKARYERRFGTAAYTTQGAHYRDGAIHVNGGSRLDVHFLGTMVHEMTHAVLDHRGTGSRLPVWLNEGLAERLSWKRMGVDDLAPNQREAIRYAGRQRTLVPLPARRPPTLDYLQCRAAVLFLEAKAGREKVLAVVRRTLEGTPYERALDQETRLSPADLDREFVAWVEHLP